jgi:hypothetical protein
MKYFSKIIYSLCFLWWVGIVCNQVQAQTLHAFVITESVAPGAVKDKVLMKREIERIARLTGMNAQTYVFRHNQSGLVNRIRSLSPSSQDVILFYYSGHGGNSGNGWPEFSNSGDRFTLKQTDIRELMRSKRARLKITLYDCCNGGRTNAPYLAKAKTKPSLAHVYNLLFKKFRGEIMACASASGAFAYGDNDSGSYFTLSLLDAFTKIELGSNAWDELASKTIAGTNDLCSQANRGRQTPKFFVKVEYTGSRTNGGSVINPHAAPDKIVVGQNGHNFDNLRQIVNRFKNDSRHQDISVAKLMKWNKMQGTRVYNGQEIRLVQPFKSLKD